MNFATELPRSSGAPGIARRELSRWCGDSLELDDLQTAKLLISELVTNAVLHGRGRIVLRAQLNDDRLLVEVIDEGAGLEHESGWMQRSRGLRARCGERTRSTDAAMIIGSR